MHRKLRDCEKRQYDIHREKGELEVKSKQVFVQFEEQRDEVEALKKLTNGLDDEKVELIEELGRVRRMNTESQIN